MLAKLHLPPVLSAQTSLLAGMSIHILQIRSVVQTVLVLVLLTMAMGPEEGNPAGFLGISLLGGWEYMGAQLLAVLIRLEY